MVVLTTSKINSIESAIYQALIDNGFNYGDFNHGNYK